MQEQHLVAEPVALGTTPRTTPRVIVASVPHANDQRPFDFDPSSIERDLMDRLPPALLRKAKRLGQRAIPALAKDTRASATIEAAVRQLPTRHLLILGDSRSALATIPDASVHLVVTSPPYWTLKEYAHSAGQLGDIEDYEQFLGALDAVWRECLRVLVPGGRLIINVGDVCLPRRTFGRHVVVPLHASIQEHCRGMGFDNLSPIIWHKIANATYEADGSSGGFLGKPYEPNAVVKNDIEFILFQRKPGGYRAPSAVARIGSLIPAHAHKEWFQQIWSLGGASTRVHPAPFPVALIERLVRMFSFIGDVVLDPFTGTGTTNLAAGCWGRQSIGIEVEPSYLRIAEERLAVFRHPQLAFDLRGV